MRRYRRRLLAAWRVLRGGAVIEAPSYTLLWHGARPMVVENGTFASGHIVNATISGPPNLAWSNG